MDDTHLYTSYQPAANKLTNKVFFVIGDYFLTLIQEKD